LIIESHKSSKIILRNVAEKIERRNMTTSEMEEVHRPGGKTTTGKTTTLVPMEGRQKTEISARLKKAVDAAKKVKNRSSDLIPLSQKYDRMRKKLRNLLQASKNYHSAMTQVDKTRMEVSVLIREQAVGCGGFLSKSSIYHVHIFLLVLVHAYYAWYLVVGGRSSVDNVAGITIVRLCWQIG
jgi:hypothetical protein